MGFFRIARGNNTLGVESRCVWATPGAPQPAGYAPFACLCAEALLTMAGAWTEGNIPCYEDGSNCVVTASYREPGAAPEGLRVAHGEEALARAALLRRAEKALLAGEL